MIPTNIQRILLEDPVPFVRLALLENRRLDSEFLDGLSDDLNPTVHACTLLVPNLSPLCMKSWAEFDEELDAVTEMIESYPGDYSSACYAVPAPGEVGYSMPLQDAMAEYDRTVTYRVYVDIFKAGAETPMDGDDKEVAELLGMLSRDYGITTALEKVKDANGKKHVYPTLHATFDQLRRFPGDEDHGWMLFLYDEKAE